MPDGMVRRRITLRLSRALRRVVFCRPRRRIRRASTEQDYLRGPSLRTLFALRRWRRSARSCRRPARPDPPGRRGAGSGLPLSLDFAVIDQRRSGCSARSDSSAMLSATSGSSRRSADGHHQGAAQASFCRSESDLQAVTARVPGVLLTICSSVIQRLRRPEPLSSAPAKVRTFRFVPADSSIDIRPIIEQVACLEAFGTVTVLSPEQTSGQTSTWFSEIERCFDFVLFHGESGQSPWTRFCLRQSDRVVVLAQGEARPADCPSLAMVRMDLPRDTRCP